MLSTALLFSALLGFAQKGAHNKLSKKEIKRGYVLLYDGVSSNGWKSARTDKFPEKGWEFANGELRVLPAPDPSKHVGLGGDIITTKQYKAFDLSWDFKLEKGGNSGLKYFVTVKNNYPLGLEFQLLDDNENADSKGGKDGNHKLAGLYDLIPANKGNFVFVPDTWYNARLVVYPNNHVEHYLNGVKVLEYERGSPEFKKLVSQSKYKDQSNFGLSEQGYILLQDHGHAVSFRNMKLKELVAK